MVGSYGAETLRNGRYRLSFTVGGLLVQQGRILAALFVRNKLGGNDDAKEVSSVSTVAEIGDRIIQIRHLALEGNVLFMRTQAANSRVVTEVCKRLSTLTETEIRHLADPDALAADCRALMWVAMCRYYALVGEFACEVLRDHYLLNAPMVTREDYDRFVRSKAAWHTELEELSPTTANKLRTNVFRAMVEAGLLEQDGRTLVPSLLGEAVTGMLESRPESFLYFPMRES